MRLTIKLLVGAAAFLALLAAVLFRPHAPVRLALLSTASTFAYARPCGCCEGQLGGLARRATYLVDLKDSIEHTTSSGAAPPKEELPEDFVLLDCGSFTD